MLLCASNEIVHPVLNDRIKQNVKVKRMQRSGTEAIRTKIQPSKPKREITKITNSQTTKRTYSQPSEPADFDPKLTDQVVVLALKNKKKMFSFLNSETQKKKNDGPDSIVSNS